MRVLHVINSLRVGGAEKLVEELVPEISRFEDIRADVLILSNQNNVFETALVEKGVNIKTSPAKDIYSLKNIHYLKKAILEREYDIVHAHLFPAFYWVSIAARMVKGKKPKLVLTEHSTSNSRRKKKYLRTLERFIYLSYDKIISASLPIQESLIEWIRPKQEEIDKFIVIQNGIDVEKFITTKPFSKQDIVGGLTEESKLICMVARFTEAKDQATLIKAMKRLPNNVHLLLVGDGPLKRINQQLAADLQLEERVHFLGFRDDIPRILKTVDVVVLSSNWEGLPLSLLEGMAAGKPVVGSNVPGVRELIQGTGLIFEKGNDKDLANKIEMLLENEELYRKTQQACVKKAAEYSIKETAKKYVEVYRNLLKD
ncbi:glycosyltransferase [Fervidobacterium sp.]